MTCTQIHDQLPLLLYGDLTPGDVATVEQHLVECSNCRDALAALQQVRDGLNAMPTPEVVVHPAQVFLASSARPQRRRWITWTVAGGVAASLLAFALLNLEVRLDGQQLVVRWGRTPAINVAQNINPSPANADALASLEERVRVLQELTHALSRDADRRDRMRTDDMMRTKAQMEALVQSSGQQIGETRRDVDALYAAHFKSSETGAKP